MTFLEKMTDAELAQIRRLGYFLGSFDPLHLGHIEVLKIILERQLCDAVLIYCVQGKSDWKQRSDFIERTKFCESKLRRMRGVIISYLSPQELQDRLTSREEAPGVQGRVRSKFSHHITGIIGADIACGLEFANLNLAIERLRRMRQKDFMQGIPLAPDFNDSIACSIALPAEDFIVALRRGYSIEDIPKTVCTKKVRKVIDTYEYRHLSSSEIKRCAIGMNGV